MKSDDKINSYGSLGKDSFNTKPNGTVPSEYSYGYDDYGNQYSYDRQNGGVVQQNGSVIENAGYGYDAPVAINTDYFTQYGQPTYETKEEFVQKQAHEHVYYSDDEKDI